MSDREDLFVRGGNGSVIGIALDGHPDAGPADADGNAPTPTTMIPVLPIPEFATIGPLPDVVTQANDLANANARIADLEARLSAASAPAGPTPEETAAARIAELEAELATRSSSSPTVPPNPSSSSSPLAAAPVVAEVPVPPSAPVIDEVGKSAPSWQELAGGSAPADPTAPSGQ